MEQRTIEGLGVKLGMLAAGLTDLSDRLTRQSEQSSDQLGRIAHSLARTAETSAQLAASELTRLTVDAMAAGTEAATRAMERSLVDASERLIHATSSMEQKVRALNRLHVASTWKALFAAGTSVLAAGGAAFAVGYQAYEQVDEATWFTEIKEARSRGTLRPCPEGGVCVYLNKRWHRLGR